MFRNVILLLLTFLVEAVFAQDTIYKSNGNSVKAIISDKSTDVIHYSFFENHSGPTFILHKNYIDSIKLENGTIEVFPKILIQRSVPKHKNNPDLIDFKRNNISYNAFDLFFEMITFNYEHIFKSGNFSFSIPLSFTFNPLEKNPDANQFYNYDEENAKFGTGINFNFYPFGQQKNAWYISIAYDYQLYQFYESRYSNDYITYVTERETRVMNGFLMQTGFVFHTSNRLNFGLNAGIGFRFATKTDSYGGDNGPLIRVGLSLGYKF